LGFLEVGGGGTIPELTVGSPFEGKDCAKRASINNIKLLTNCGRRRAWVISAGAALFKTGTAGVGGMEGMGDTRRAPERP